ncbi:MAG: hypothetical protein IKU43_08615 [Clostridia bacterium]|nr:hypothetical protein [Clostridia bacterium]
MKSKRILSLLLASLLCLTSFTALADEAEEIVTAEEEAAARETEVAEELTVPTEETPDDPTEEIVAMPDDDNDGSIDYSDMFNRAYRSEEEEKEADLFFICPTVDMGDAGILPAHVEKDAEDPSITQIIIASFYVDENNKITYVSEFDGMFLLD